MATKEKISPENKKQLEDLLWNIFKNVNSWLEFAEKKNGVLATAVGISSALNFFNANSTLLTFASFAGGLKTIGILLVLFAWLVAISSFLPQMEFMKLLRKLYPREFQFGLFEKVTVKTEPQANHHSEDNLLFWGHINKYNPDDYLNAIQLKYDLNGEAGNLARQLSAQIVTNSVISTRKYRLFSRSLKLVLAGASLIIISMLWK